MNGEADIAIVGMAGRLPGARDLGEFWRNLAGGVESITRLSDAEILRSGVPAADLRDPSYVKAAPVLEAPEQFDAAFFGYSPAEAAAIDPQHRLLLELAYEALEHAGCDPERYAGRVGVFAGAALNTYYTSVGLSGRLAREYIPTLIGNDKDFLSTRISYKLNLKGPSVTVQTACSTSMVAVHLARQSLLAEESDMALAGAVSVRVPHRAGYFCDGGGVVSRQGHVRAFDAGADGTVFGSGGGVLVLKRWADAMADGDTIHAVIKGSAVNNDGSAKAGYTAPSVDSQADAVVEALANAGVKADAISYLEAHGSGTPLGDPIEVRALTKAFRSSTQRSGYCAIGSVKTNVGHLDAAAGVAGILKTVLALEHRMLPPSLNFTAPNPEIDFARSPFYVNTRLREWACDGPRRAGVMSTGMGGTNAHLVLEEAPQAPAGPRARPAQLLVLSARTEAALEQASERLRDFLRGNEGVSMDDVAYTLQTGRRAFAHRRCLACTGRDDALAALDETRSKRILEARAPESRRPVIFLLPGIGDHYVGMGRDLYEAWPEFGQEVDRCARILEPLLGVDIRSILYPQGQRRESARPGKGIDLARMLGGDRGPPEDEHARALNRTLFAQPAQFAIEYATCRLWQSLGVTPDAIAGHSMGEYVAACLAGVMSLEDALRLVAVRARLVSELPQGAMLAVTLSEAKLRPLLRDGLCISLINGPQLCVVAGAPADVDALEARLSRSGVLCRRVRNTHAFHSPLLEPIVEPLRRELGRVRLHEPRIAYISNVTGTWVSAGEALSPDYWLAHATRTARFSDALRALWKFERPILLEAGPGRTLGVLAMQHPDRPEGGDAVVVSSIRHEYESGPDVQFLWQAVARLWLGGARINWDAAPAGRRRRVPLPTYPFERQRHWLEPVQAPAARQATGQLRKNPDPSAWLYAPSWKRALPRALGAREVAARLQQPHTWLVFEDDVGCMPASTARLRSAGHDVLTVRAGAGFEQTGASAFILDPGEAQHYDQLLRALQAGRRLPERIVHAWSVTGGTSDVARGNGFERAQALGFHSLVFLARALGAHHVRHPIELSVLCDRVHDVRGTETLCPEKSTLLGPCTVIRQEYPHIRVRNIDVEGPAEGDDAAADRILAELLAPESGLVVAHRDGQRWIQCYEPAAVGDGGRGAASFRTDGTYLITGGFGQIGHALARYLAERYRARLVLVGRSAPQAAAIEEIGRRGGEVLCVQADVADERAVRDAVARAEQRFGPLHGVIHGAGIVGERGYCEIKDSDRGSGEAHFRAKARGVLALEKALEGRQPDFCLLLSSLTSVLGGIGQVAYASANIFMDAYARWHNRASPVRWLSVNWDVWRLAGEDAGGAGAGATLRELGMNAAEAMHTLEAVLALDGPAQLAVSTGDLGARIDQWVRLESLEAAAQHSPPQPSRRPALRTAFDAPRDDTERQIARVWQDALGIDAVGIHDGFADLGGHSLLAVRIVGELSRRFRIDLPLRALFDAPTVAELARYVDALAWTSASGRASTTAGGRVEIDL